MEKIRVTEENWADFEEAVCQRLAQPLEIEAFKQYSVWDFLGDIGFTFSGPQGVDVIKKHLEPKVLKKVPDAKFSVIIWHNAFAFQFPSLWAEACARAHSEGYATPHARGNVPVIRLP